MSSEHKYMYYNYLFFIVFSDRYGRSLPNHNLQLPAGRYSVSTHLIIIALFFQRRKPHGGILFFNPPGGFKCILQNGMIFSSE